MYSREVVTEVLAANDIVDVIGAYVDLKPTGPDRLVGLSPFQNERTPSFNVSRSKQAYYCFSSGQGGDAITFLREVEGLTFNEALERLADKAGIRLPAPSGSTDKEEAERKQLHDLGAFALRKYAEMLDNPLKGGKGRAYLKTRGLKPATIKRFGIGYAPDAWTTLLDAARPAGYSEHLLETSGLAKRGPKGGLYDFFRDRLMIPIRDVSGHVVAFGGRDVGGDSAAKYINTPENRVYKKGRVLYGVYESREALRRSGTALLVEGYFDLIRCHDAGIEEVVASCGTALTAEQARLLRRYVSEVVLVYDGDAAGVRAAARGIGVLLENGLSVRVMALPEGMDPDDFIRQEGPEAFRDKAREAMDFVAFYAHANRGRLTNIEGRNAVANELFAALRGMQDQLRLDEYLRQVAKTLQLNEWAVRQAFARGTQDTPQGASESGDRPPGKATFRPFKVNPDDMVFLSALLQHQDVFERFVQNTQAIDWPEAPVYEIVRAMREHGWERYSPASLHAEAQQLYAAAANAEAMDFEKARWLVMMRTRTLERQHLLEEGRRLEEAIRQAERDRDTTRLIELVKQRGMVSQKLDKAGAS